MEPSKSDLYKELGENFRVTLRWRELLFGGFLTLSGALTFGFFQLAKEEKRIFPYDIAWLIPVAGVLLAVCFFLLDKRCHEVLIGHYQLGKDLEEPNAGTYTFAQKRGLNPIQITHSAVLQSVYLGSALIFLVFAARAYGGTEVIATATQAVVPLWPRLLKSLPGLFLVYLASRLMSAAFPENAKSAFEKSIADAVWRRQIAGIVLGAAGLALLVIELYGVA